MMQGEEHTPDCEWDLVLSLFGKNPYLSDLRFLSCNRRGILKSSGEQVIYRMLSSFDART